MNFAASVWKRTGHDEMSRHQFMFLYGAFTMLGMAFTAVTAHLTIDWMHANPEAHFDLWTLLLVIGMPFLGVFIGLRSGNPVVSLIGYAMVAGPFGVLLGPLVMHYTAASVAKVLTITCSITVICAVIGAVMPESLQKWGTFLFLGLLVLLLGMFAIPVLGWLVPGFPIKGALSFWDWMGVILFSGYVIFDVNRAMEVPATLDNAIDCALALYLDVANIFIRLLAQTGSSDSSSDSSSSDS